RTGYLQYFYSLGAIVSSGASIAPRRLPTILKPCFIGRLLAAAVTITPGNLPTPSISLTRLSPTYENRHFTSKTLRSDCHLLCQNAILKSHLTLHAQFITFHRMTW